MARERTKKTTSLRTAFVRIIDILRLGFSFPRVSSGLFWGEEKPVCWSLGFSGRKNQNQSQASNRSRPDRHKAKKPETFSYMENKYPLGKDGRVCRGRSWGNQPKAAAQDWWAFHFHTGDEEPRFMRGPASQIKWSGSCFWAMLEKKRMGEPRRGRPEEREKRSGAAVGWLPKTLGSGCPRSQRKWAGGP